jgi:small subunit ribosomal protein S21
MLIINVKDNESIEKAIRRFRRKVRQTKLMRELRNKRFYDKPSVERRREVLKAVYRENKKEEMGY